MLTLSTLRNILSGEIDGLTDVNEQVIESAGGYDGIISLIQQKGIDLAIILENNELGEFSFRPGGFLTATQSIWVMEKVGANDDRQARQANALVITKRVLSVLANNKNTTALASWQPEHIPYGVRNAGANFTGYEFSLNFAEDTDLEYHAL